MRTPPRSRLFLLELVCDLVIFALCAAVCVALLVQARSMSRESTQLTQAVYIAQDAAERIRSGREVYSGYTADGAPVTTVPAAEPGSLEPMGPVGTQRRSRCSTGSRSCPASPSIP